MTGRDETVAELVDVMAFVETLHTHKKHQTSGSARDVVEAFRKVMFGIVTTREVHGLDERLRAAEELRRGKDDHADDEDQAIGVLKAVACRRLADALVALAFKSGGAT